MVNRQSMIVLALAGLAVLSVLMFVTWCPPDACRALHIQTYTISGLDDYRQFLADDAAFLARHHVRAIRLDCSALRDDVVTALTTGHLTLGISNQDGAEERTIRAGPIQAWYQGQLLHLTYNASNDHRQATEWVGSIQNGVAGQERRDLSFLPRLFGGLILHVQNKETPIVFFSDQPCT